MKLDFVFFVHNRLLNKLNQALENSGIDLSQASISVQINLGKRAMKRSTPAATSTSKVGFMSRIDTKSHYIMFVVIEIGAGNGCYTWFSCFTMLTSLVITQFGPPRQFLGSIRAFLQSAQFNPLTLLSDMLFTL